MYLCHFQLDSCLPAPPCNLGNTWGQVETHGNISGSCQSVYTKCVCICVQGVLINVHEVSMG